MDDGLVDKFILDGILEVSGIDAKTGEFLYSFTHKLKDAYPELYDEVQNYISKEVMSLWQGGFVSMDVTEQNPIVSLTDKAFINDEVDKLSEDLKHALGEIKRLTAL